ncbi:hypothetical protein RDI58_013937 [Solanum bulbocastanum]|uniref:Uncharacterized protein n=1 Tax=Solanum bulbocastanum TaxID=147425 RepID=A0AAN8YF50_SOLBU
MREEKLRQFGPWQRARMNTPVRSIIKAFILAVFLAAVVVSAQEPSLAPAPAPDAGAAFSLPVSGSLIGTSLLMSLFAVLRH